VTEGKIRYYGWSTDDPVRARLFANGSNCTSIQMRLNLLESDAETLPVCEEYNLAAINRSPLGMGLLTGKFNIDSILPPNDVRNRRSIFLEERAILLAKLDNVRAILVEDGRTLAQAALGWLWARSSRNIPIPGFKTITQVKENASSMRFEPLSEDQMHRIEDTLKNIIE
jgi:aryl-alcohol dehydrogenase-like predicted oxidoreductase